MKIVIFTVYEPTTNIGSFLQAYALKLTLENMGYEVVFAEKTSKIKSIKNHICKMNPKRAFFMRIRHGINSFRALNMLKTVPKKKLHTANIDAAIYGSDEIWNLDNQYFNDGMFWGDSLGNIPKIAYAVSCGSMTEQTLQLHPEYIDNISKYNKILVRDSHTYDVLNSCFKKEFSFVCDPTFLVPTSNLQLRKPLHKVKGKYLLVYTYGVNKEQEQLIIRFAKEKKLKMVSVHFWHSWCDICLPISPLEFGTIISQADYVFTTTFHGAVFTMLNHKKCAIMPWREKVRDVVVKMKAEKHLLPLSCNYDEFKNTMERNFDIVPFEESVNLLRKESIERLKEALECLD